MGYFRGINARFSEEVSILGLDLQSSPQEQIRHLRCRMIECDNINTQSCRLADTDRKAEANASALQKGL